MQSMSSSIKDSGPKVLNTKHYSLNVMNRSHHERFKLRIISLRNTRNIYGDLGGSCFLKDVSKLESPTTELITW